MNELETIKALTDKQLAVIPLIIIHGDIEKACKEADISKGSYYKWLEIPAFRNELETQRDRVYKDSLWQLKSLVNKSINVFSELIESGDDNTRYKVANSVLDKITKVIEFQEIEKRLEAIENK
jgi:hypothetical protein